VRAGAEGDGISGSDSIYPDKETRQNHPLCHHKGEIQLTPTVSTLCSHQSFGFSGFTGASQA
ncbi:MAG: hypothetical protein ABL994_25555, partial [Verrucomicrobiales bacterium]